MKKEKQAKFLKKSSFSIDSNKPQHVQIKENGILVGKKVLFVINFEMSCKALKNFK
jgi:hypothetical protein